MSYSITLQFESYPTLRLQHSCLITPSGERREAELISPATPKGQRSFVWCQAIKIASYLFTLAAAKARAGDRRHPLFISHPSPLSALSSALAGKGGALEPILVTTPEEPKPLGSQIFIPTNLRQRRPGPAAVTIDDSVLPWKDITILVDDTRIITVEQLNSLAEELGILSGLCTPDGNLGAPAPACS